MNNLQMIRTRHHPRLVLDIMEMGDQKQAFAQEVAAGLSRDPKSIPPMFFYDMEGSRLFEQITELEAYYPTRTEAAILAVHGEDILAAAGECLAVVELGSGSSTKTRLLLDILARKQYRVDYTPIDISPTVVTEFGKQLLADYPDLHIRGLICDYHHALEVLESKNNDGVSFLYLFLGSSLGNYSPEQALVLLKAIRQNLNPGDRLLLGVDLKKDENILHGAYNDESGVTAAFNMNLLTRINRELGGEFNPERFQHRAFYNQKEGRIEMHLESLESQIVPVAALERSFAFTAGETLHTENSYKFDTQSLEAMASKSDMRLLQQWTDERGWFALNLLAPR